MYELRRKRSEYYLLITPQAQVKDKKKSMSELVSGVSFSYMLMFYVSMP